MITIVNCPNCNREISPYAENCPRCDFAARDYFDVERIKKNTKDIRLQKEQLEKELKVVELELIKKQDDLRHIKSNLEVKEREYKRYRVKLEASQTDYRFHNSILLWRILGLAVFCTGILIYSACYVGSLMLFALGVVLMMYGHKVGECSDGTSDGCDSGTGLRNDVRRGHLFRAVGDYVQYGELKKNNELLKQVRDENRRERDGNKFKIYRD